jgi:membrane dipeptidase
LIIVDAHCDTASTALDQKEDLYRNQLHVDLERLLGEDGRVQFFDAFANPFKFSSNSLTRILSILDYIFISEEKYPSHLLICRNTSDLDLALKQGKVAAILSVEGGEALNGELAVLRLLYRLGVRSLILTWNYRNLLADGAHESCGAGLSEFGRLVVTEMNRLGMLIDVSHLCEAGFNDVLELSNKPVIASHSNAKAVLNHVRNLSDAQLIALKRNGGVAGINFYPLFLAGSGRAVIDDVIRHIEHICSITGEDHIGIGTDFDGIDSTPAGLEGAQQLYALFDRLFALNYSGAFIEKFAGLNFLRVIRQILS